MLKSNVIWPDSRRFKSRSEWEPIGFFSEALCNATQFDLKLGFFSSAAINVLADSFAAFLYNGGRMRMIINDILSEEDKDAIVHGQGKDVAKGAFNLDNIEELSKSLSKRDEHFFECLSWLIRKGRIDIKIITPKNEFGIAHSKCGVFSDGTNKVAFDGSCNFSRTALLENIESVTSFCDWDGGCEQFKIKDIEDEFELTFSGFDENVNYLDASNFADHVVTHFNEKDLDLLVEEERLIIEERLAQNDIPSTVRRVLDVAKSKLRSIVLEEREKVEALSCEKEPCFPYAEPRDYQKKAFENWKANGQKGLFAMATGTGKTITSLNCLLEIYKRTKCYKAIILVPTVTLIDQWETECRRFNFYRIIKVYSKNSLWNDEVERILFDEDHCPVGSDVSYVIISTYASFSRKRVFDALSKFPHKRLLLIADEAHNMGAPGVLKRLKEIPYLRRIGLSATPERQFDDKTNHRVFSFFGAEKGYTFEYSMEEAIENGALCRYFYYPHLVQLTDTEMEQYVDLSIKISRYFNFNSCTFEKKDEILTSLLLARKRIIHKAVNKLNVFSDIIAKRYEEKQTLKYTLVYVPEGGATEELYDYLDDDEDEEGGEEYEKLIDLFTAEISKLNNYITVRKFTSDSKDRNAMLEDFASGKLQVLTSMKCLDEGIDVPRSEMAIFCASTGNERQFVQRRGRILRKHPDKKYAIIHDLVVIPKVSPQSPSYKMEQSLLIGELKRVNNFALLSENPSCAQLELNDVMDYYGLNLFNNNHIS
jgi:superfamily II DNA or RNA helicase